MTWSDPIVDEVRRVREAYAARFQYDLRAIARDLKAKEKCGGRPVVPYVARAAGEQKLPQTTNKANDISLDSKPTKGDSTLIETSPVPPPAAPPGG